MADITLPTNYSIRPATLDDLEGAVALFNACSLAMEGSQPFTLEEIRGRWHTPTFNMEDSTRVVLTSDGQIVGYAEVWTNRKPPVHPWVWVRVYPEAKDQSIGVYLYQWAEGCARQAIPECPPDARVSCQTQIPAGHQPSENLLTNCGMEAVRHAYTMVVDFKNAPPDPQLPPGITVRAYRHPIELEAVIRAVQDAFRDHWGFVAPPVEGALIQWRHMIESDQEFDPALWTLAIDDQSSQIAGMSLCRMRSFDDPDMGWVNTLGVRRPWRKRGLGLALLYHSFGEFWTRGQKRVGLGVDASSLTGAVRLYEHAGMHIHKQFTTYEKELRPGVELGVISVEG